MLNKDQIKDEFEKKFNTFRVGVMYTRVFDDKDREKYHDVRRDSFNQDDVLNFLSAQYEKLIEEVMPPYSKGIDKVPEVMEKDRLYNLMNENMVIGYNEAIQDIRTSLQERGIKIK